MVQARYVDRIKSQLGYDLCFHNIINNQRMNELYIFIKEAKDKEETKTEATTNVYNFKSSK